MRSVQRLSLGLPVGTIRPAPLRPLVPVEARPFKNADDVVDRTFYFTFLQGIRSGVGEEESFKGNLPCQCLQFLES